MRPFSCWIAALTARFMGPTWGPHGADRTHVGPMLAPWTLLSGRITPGNPFARLEKMQRSLVIFFFAKCPCWLILPIGINWRAFPPRSRHISVGFYVSETTRCASDVLPEHANWQSTFYNAYAVETAAIVMKFQVSLHIKAKHWRHIGFFTNIKSKRNMSSSD